MGDAKTGHSQDLPLARRVWYWQGGGIPGSLGLPLGRNSDGVKAGGLPPPGVGARDARSPLEVTLTSRGPRDYPQRTTAFNPEKGDSA